MKWLGTPFKAAGSYPEMLDKIASWTFIVTLLLVLLLAWQVPSLNHLVQALHQKVDIKDLPFSIAAVPLGAVLVAWGVAWLTRSIRWHNQLSDMFRIRSRFDVHHILLPLAASCGVGLTAQQLTRLRTDREDLMERVFYHYIHTNPRALTEHSVEQAIDRWGNLWILSESSSIAFLAAIVLAAVASWAWATLLLSLMLVAIGAMHLIRIDCERHVRTQVAMILNSQGSQAHLHSIFSAL